MKSQEFYEKQRKNGLTYNITSNSNPDYDLLFYQQIFDLMEQYHRDRIREELVKFAEHTFTSLSISHNTGGLKIFVDEYLKNK